MRIRELPNEDRKLWDDYVHGSTNGLPQHLYAWRDVLHETYGYATKYIVAEEPVEGANGVRAVYLVFKGSRDKSVVRKFDPERLFDLESFRFVAG